METVDCRWQEYYITGKYNGYYPVDNTSDAQLPGQQNITFSNGEIEVFATGLYKEDAIAKIFDQIDKIVASEGRASTPTESSNSEPRLLAKATG